MKQYVCSLILLCIGVNAMSDQQPQQREDAWSNAQQAIIDGNLTSFNQHVSADILHDFRINPRNNNAPITLLETALHHEHENPETTRTILNKLFELGCDPHQSIYFNIPLQNRQQKTCVIQGKTHLPLDEAIYASNVTAVRLLLEKYRVDPEITQEQWNFTVFARVLNLFARKQQTPLLHAVHISSSSIEQRQREKAETICAIIQDAINRKRQEADHAFVERTMADVHGMQCIIL